MLERARVLVPLEHVEFLVGDGVTLQPIGDGTADLVVSFTVLQPLPSRDLVLGYLPEGARVLRPDGVLAVQWNNLPRPAFGHLQGRWWRLLARAGSKGQRSEKRNAAEFVGTRVKWAHVRDTVEAAGLEMKARNDEGTLFAWVFAQKPS